MSAFEEKAIPFIQFENDKLIINEEAEKFLKLISPPIGIVSITGFFSTGKSYLLNQVMLNQPSGFPISKNSNLCTKGFWIWKKPIAGFTSE